MIEYEDHDFTEGHRLAVDDPAVEKELAEKVAARHQFADQLLAIKEAMRGSGKIREEELNRLSQLIMELNHY